MATLTAAISSSVTEFSVSGDVSAARTGQEYRIDDEVIVLREFVRTKAERRGPRNRNRWSVSRGQAGTTAASHLIGAEIFALNGAVATGVSLAEPEPFAGTGTGGGVTVDNQSDPPAPIESFVIPGAVITGTEADLSAVAGVQTVRLLGPYRVTFETPDIADGGGNFAEIAEDVVPVGATVIKAWASSIVQWITPTTDAKVIIAMGPAAGQDPVWEAPDASDTPNAAPLNQRSYLPEDFHHRTYTARAVSSIWARVVDLTDESAPTEGEMDVYVLIAEPSA